MNRIVKTLLHVAVGLLASGPLLAQSQRTEADLILTNGEIRTPTGWVQALAVQRGVIVALGDNAAATAYKGVRTKVVDLKGAAVVPGLHDMHVHPTGAGLWQQRCMFPQGSSAQAVLAQIRSCVAARGKNEWITGGSWDAASFGNTPPHRALLDSVAPSNPVYLNDISGHSALVNSRALELAGITRSTPNPPGGIIERDASGEATGVLRESANGLVSRNIPPSTHAENVKALKWSLEQLLSFGITSFTDAGTDEGIMRAYAAISDEGQLKQRVRGCYMWRPTTFTGGSAGSPIERLALYARPRFAPDCVKLVLDGVPTDGHTAAMVEPYADALDRDDVRARGLLMIPAETLKTTVTDLDHRGLTVKFHAAGDAAVRAGLDAIEAARKANGYSGLRHDVGHNSFVQLSDVSRGRSLAATFEMSPYIWSPGPIIPDIAKAIGPERMKRWIPVKDVLDAGALVVPGSDWPVVPSLNPWPAIESLVTRQVPGGGGEVLGAAERITLEQAFDLFTVNSAQQMGNANKTGQIAVGMLADVLVLDRNPYRIAPTDIHNTNVRMTIINGDVAWQSP